VETANSVFNNSQVGAGVLSHHVTINNVRTTQFDLVVATQNEWGLMKDSLKGSCIQSADEYYYNYSHLIDFTGLPSTELNPNLDAGLPLDVECKIDVMASCRDAALNHYVFAVCQRTLNLSPDGAIFT
jgi:hypothetical protein